MAQPTVAAEPEINDALPENAEVLGENDAQIAALFNRFGIGPELKEEPAPSPSGHRPDATPPPEPEPQSVESGLRPDDPVAAPTEPSGQRPDATPAEDPAKVLETEKAKWTADVLTPLQAEHAAALEQVEALQTRLQNLSSPAPTPKEIDPLLYEDDLTALDKEEREASAALAWCDDHEDEGYTPTKEGEAAWTPAQVRKLRRALETKLNRTLPQARDLVQARAQKRTEVRQAYPELFDPKNDASKIRAGIYARAPWIRAVFPQFDLWLGHMVVGEKIFNERSQRAKSSATAPASNAASPPPASRPPVRPSPGGPPLSTGGAPSRAAQPKGVDVQKFIEAGGTRNALVDLIRSSNL